MEIQEKFLYHIWDQRHLLPELRTISGKTVKILYQGQYNTSNGPDFKNVVLSIDGNTLQGDVEVHKKSYDWIAHQHHEDIAYNNTILHVVLEHKSNAHYTIREDAQQVEILELENQIDSDIAKLFVQYSANPVNVKSDVCDLFTLSPKEIVPALLKENGWERFTKKVKRYNAELHFTSFDQLLFNGFMEALGYDKNKFNTLFLAQHFTWSTLNEWRDEGLDEITLASIWLTFAGLMPAAVKKLPTEDIEKLKCAYEWQKFNSEKSCIAWNLFRIRPSSHPVTRILQASSFVTSILPKGFLTTLLEMFSQNADGKNRELLKDFSAFFQHNTYRKSGFKPIGKELILNIIGNVFLPVVYLYAHKVNDTHLVDNIRKIYVTFPAAGYNHITAFMKNRVKEKAIFAKHLNFIDHQGMMNLYYKFCRYKLCNLCLAEKELQLKSL